MSELDSDKPSYFIRRVDFDDEESMQIIAEMHMELLHFGPMAALGERFIREICYQKLVQDGVMQVAILEIDGAAAGFIAYTPLPYEFHKGIMYRNFFRASYLAMLSLLQRPSRIIRLLRVARTIMARVDESVRHEPNLGEIVCIAVRPAYLKSSVIKDIGIRVPDELLRFAARELFEKKQVRRLRMIVDAENRHALFLYHRLGARFEQRVWAGEDKTDVQFELSQDAPIMRLQ